MKLAVAFFSLITADISKNQFMAVVKPVALKCFIDSNRCFLLKNLLEMAILSIPTDDFNWRFLSRILVLLIPTDDFSRNNLLEKVSIENSTGQTLE